MHDLIAERYERVATILTSNLDFDELDQAFAVNSKRLASAREDRTINWWDVASGKSISRRSGLHEFVHAVAFSAEGKQLATAFGDGKVSPWGAASRKVLATLDQDRERATSVAFSPVGLWLASGSWDKTVILWTRTPRAWRTPLPEGQSQPDLRRVPRKHRH